MTQEEYQTKVHQIEVLDNLLLEFRGNTSLNTIRCSLIAQCKNYIQTNGAPIISCKDRQYNIRLDSVKNEDGGFDFKQTFFIDNKEYSFSELPLGEQEIFHNGIKDTDRTLSLISLVKELDLIDNVKQK